MLRLWRKTRWLRLWRISRIWIRLKNETIFYSAYKNIEKNMDKKYCKENMDIIMNVVFFWTNVLYGDFTSERGEEQSQL